MKLCGESGKGGCDFGNFLRECRCVGVEVDVFVPPCDSWFCWMFDSDFSSEPDGENLEQVCIPTLCCHFSLFYQKVRRLDSSPLKSVFFPYKVWFIFPKKCADSTLFYLKSAPTRFCLAQKVRRLDLYFPHTVRRLNFCPPKSAPTRFVFLKCADMNLFLKSAPTALCDD